MSTREVAQSLIARGWAPIPVPRGEKGPKLTGWQHLRLADASTFKDDDNIGVITGEASGWLVCIDFDCLEARALGSKYLPYTPCKSGRGGNPDSHWWYISAGARPLKLTDRENGSVIVELRSTGQQTIVGPSTHPTGDQYDCVPQEEPAEIPSEMLESCVKALADAVNRNRHGEQQQAKKRPSPAPTYRPTGGPSVEDRALKYLLSMPPAISGQNGHGATLAAATAMVHGFGLDPSLAEVLLLDHFNPRCAPPWEEKEIVRKCSEAARISHDKPHGWLRDQELPFIERDDSDIDLSRLMAVTNAAPARPAELGSIPQEMLRIPGFVSEVMDLTLSTAPQPNQSLAFAGALSLLALLTGRKVRDNGNARTNTYTISLARSGSGKDWPRKVNFEILDRIDALGAVGDRVSSGESLQDRLVTCPAMFLQTDEIDELFSSMLLGSKGHMASFQKIIMSLWSASGSKYPRRIKTEIKRKAKGDETPEDDGAKWINQPHLVILGSAVPEKFMSSLCETMLTDGLISRMLIIDASPDIPPVEARMINPTDSIINTARYWNDFQPGGNLDSINPSPIEILYTPGAVPKRDEAVQYFYKCREASRSEAERAVWSRAMEHARKLAMLYACSENCDAPIITETAIDWACEFSHLHAKRLIAMGAKVGAEGEFERSTKKALRILNCAGGTLIHSEFLRAMRVSAKTCKELVETLVMSGDITVDFDGKSTSYRVLLGGAT